MNKINYTTNIEIRADRTAHTVQSTSGTFYVFNDQGQYYSLFRTEVDLWDYLDARTKEWKRLSFENPDIADLCIVYNAEIDEFAQKKGKTFWELKEAEIEGFIASQEWELRDESLTKDLPF